MSQTKNVTRVSTFSQSKLETLSVGDGIPLDVYTAQEAKGLIDFDLKKAEEADGVVVSMMVGEYIRANPQTMKGHSIRIYGPDSGPDSAVRKDGQLIGVRRFVRYYP